MTTPNFTPDVNLQRALEIAHATEWTGDARVNFTTAIKACKVLAEEVERLGETIEAMQAGAINTDPAYALTTRSEQIGLYAATTPKWPRYFRNSATHAWTSRQYAPGCDPKVYLNGKLQNVTQAADSIDNLVRDGVWIETDAEGNALTRPIGQQQASGVASVFMAYVDYGSVGCEAYEVVTAADHDAAMRVKDAEIAEAYEYLSRLFVHYAPQCTPLKHLSGVCTQIDNLLCSMNDKRIAEEE